MRHPPPVTEGLEGERMLQQPEPWAAQAALSVHHLPRMRGELKMALMRRAWGEDLAAIARWASVSEATAKRRLREALNEVFDTLPLPVQRDGYAAATWVSAHAECCLAEEIAQLRAEALG